MAKVRILIVVLLTLGAAGCDSEVRQAEQAVRDLQKDPDSAQFRNVRRCATGFYITGEVNGKNSYGAYAGFKTFYANSAGAHIMGDDTNDGIDYQKMCDDQAYEEAELTRIVNEAEESVANDTNAN